MKEKQDGKFMLEPRGSARRQRLQFGEVYIFEEAVSLVVCLRVVCLGEYLMKTGVHNVTKRTQTAGQTH